MPGVAAVTIAYINEEWESGAGAAMSAYVTGTVLGGFSGRMIAAVIASHASWRWAFASLGILNAAGAIAMANWLPPDRARAAPRRARPWRHTPQPASARDLRRGILRALHADRDFHLRQFLSGRAAVPFGHAGARAALHGLSAGMVVTPAGAIHRSGGPSRCDRAASRMHGGNRADADPACRRWSRGWRFSPPASSSRRPLHRATSASRRAMREPPPVGLYSVFYYAGGTLGSAMPGWFWNHGGWPACVALIAS